MPVDFLTDEQQARYGRYNGEPSLRQLSGHFHLDRRDLKWIKQRRRPHNRLGFAVQLCTARFLGTFISRPHEVPVNISLYLAQQLDIADAACLEHYIHPETHQSHCDEICRYEGYRAFNEQPGHLRLVRWLFARAWSGADRPSVLFDRATARLVENKILLPGVTTLVRLIAAVRERATSRLWRTLATIPGPECTMRLEALCTVPPHARRSELERLGRTPTRPTAKGLLGAMKRLAEIRALGVDSQSVAIVPARRLQALARFAKAAKAATVARMPRERRVATLVAFAAHMQIEAQDDVLLLFDAVVGRLFRRCDRAADKERLRSLRDLDTAALKLNQVCQALLNFTGEDVQLRAAIFAIVDRDELERAAAVVQTLAQPPDDPRSFDNLLTRYKHVRQFLPLLLDLVAFQGVDAEAPILAALRFIKENARQRRWEIDAVPMDGVAASWRRRMCDGDSVDKRAYTMWVLERVRHAMRHRNIFVTPSHRWADPRAQLLEGEAWRQAKGHVRRSLSHAASADVAIPLLFAQLDEAYRRTSHNLPDNPAVQIIKDDGRDVLSLSPLESAEEAASTKALRQTVSDLLPRVDLPEVLLEVATWTGFCDEFTHVGDTRSRAASLELSICAVLLAKACNIGLHPLARPDHPALTYDRLGWVAQNYVRPDTLSRANARLVEYHQALPMTRFFGSGDVASADGMRFVVTPQTAHAGTNSRYFGAGQGVTYYNYMSDQYTGLHALVVPGTLRDSLFVLDGLLDHHHQTQAGPHELMTDTAGYSDVVFGLFWLLGFQFSPRLADIKGARFWRADADADYGPLNGVARHRLNLDLVQENWDDVLRVAGSLLLGTVSASELMRTLNTGQGASKLTRAIAEIGRVGKTTHMLNVVDDQDHRRRIMVQLNRGENRHSLGRAIFHGERGHLQQRYREGMEDQLGCLGLVLNIVAVWNSRYMAQALDHLATTSGSRSSPQDLHHLSPLVHGHINMLGRYQFSISDPVAQGRLRALNTDPGLWGREAADRLLQSA